jgi:hypothetical protein
MIVVSTDIYCSTRILYNVFLFFQLFALLPTLSDVDYKDWAAQMKPYLMSNIKSIESTRDVKIDDMVMTTTGEGEAVESSSVTTKVKKLASPPITLAELEEQTVLTWQKHT